MLVIHGYCMSMIDIIVETKVLGTYMQNVRFQATERVAKCELAENVEGSVAECDQFMLQS